MKAILFAGLFTLMLSLQIQAQENKGSNPPYYLSYELTNQVTSELDTLAELILVVYSVDAEKIESVEYKVLTYSGEKVSHQVAGQQVKVHKTRSLAEEGEETVRMREALAFHKNYKRTGDQVSEISLGAIRMAEVKDIKIKLTMAE